jgi:Transposase DDE domain
MEVMSARWRWSKTALGGHVSDPGLIGSSRTDVIADAHVHLTLSAPDHITVSRCAVRLPVIQPAQVPHGEVDVLIDSTGLQVDGAGQWLAAQHGVKSRRTWRKLHLAVDAASGMIVAQTLTDQDANDPSQVAPLLDQIDGQITRVTADGAYDGARGSKRWGATRC